MEFKSTPVQEVKDRDEVLKSRLLNWPASFYEEIDAEVRMRLLSLSEAEKPDPENDGIREDLLKLRYVKAKDDEKFSDRFLRCLMEMKYLAANPGPRFLRGTKRKQLLKELDAIGYTRYLSGTAAEAKAYKDELLHMARLYVNLCRTDRQYGSVILGIGKMKTETLTDKIARDIAGMAYMLPAVFNAKEEMKDWTDALEHAFSMTFPASAYLLETLRKKSEL